MGLTLAMRRLRPCPTERRGVLRPSGRSFRNANRRKPVFPLPRVFGRHDGYPQIQRAKLLLEFVVGGRGKSSLRRTQER
jgi:hypothetical protein